MKTFNKNKQQGVALAIGMLLLLVVSVIGVTSMKSAMLQERMSGGLRHHEIADTAALSLMVEVERWIFNWYSVNNGTSLISGTHGILDRITNSNDIHLFKSERDLDGGFEFQNLGGHTIASQMDDSLYAEPKYIIENLSAQDSIATDGGWEETDGFNLVPVFYRVITKAVDDSGNVYVAFESTISAVYSR